MQVNHNTFWFYLIFYLPGATLSICHLSCIGSLFPPLLSSSPSPLLRRLSPIPVLDNLVRPLFLRRILRGTVLQISKSMSLDRDTIHTPSSDQHTKHNHSFCRPSIPRHSIIYWNNHVGTQELWNVSFDGFFVRSSIYRASSRLRVGQCQKGDTRSGLCRSL